MISVAKIQNSIFDMEERLEFDEQDSSTTLKNSIRKLQLAAKTNRQHSAVQKSKETTKTKKKSKANDDKKETDGDKKADAKKHKASKDSSLSPEDEENKELEKKIKAL